MSAEVTCETKNECPEVFEWLNKFQFASPEKRLYCVVELADLVAKEENRVAIHELFGEKYDHSSFSYVLPVIATTGLLREIIRGASFETVAFFVSECMKIMTLDEKSEFILSENFIDRINNGENPYHFSEFIFTGPLRKDVVDMLCEKTRYFPQIIERWGDDAQKYADYIVHACEVSDLLVKQMITKASLRSFVVQCIERLDYADGEYDYASHSFIALRLAVVFSRDPEFCEFLLHHPSKPLLSLFTVGTYCRDVTSSREHLCFEIINNLAAHDPVATFLALRDEDILFTICMVVSMNENVRVVTLALSVVEKLYSVESNRRSRGVFNKACRDLLWFVRSVSDEVKPYLIETLSVLIKYDGVCKFLGRHSSIEYIIGAPAKTTRFSVAVARFASEVLSRRHKNTRDVAFLPQTIRYLLVDFAKMSLDVSSFPNACLYSTFFDAMGLPPQPTFDHVEIGVHHSLAPLGDMKLVDPIVIKTINGRFSTTIMRNVLMYRSPFFKAKFAPILNMADSIDGVVTIDCCDDTLKLFVGYLYFGAQQNLDAPIDTLLQLLSVADFYGMFPLVRACELKLLSCIEAKDAQLLSSSSELLKCYIANLR